MAQAVTRLFDSHTEALSAVEALEAAGIHHDRISLIANNAEQWHAHQGGRSEDVTTKRGRDRDGADSEAAEGAAEGAARGGLIGGGAGLAAGLGMLAIPGLGPVVAAGWLASTAVGAIAGVIAGAATGGLLGALKDAGHSDEEANVYAEGVRRGGSLVSVKPKSTEEAVLAEQILQGRSGVAAADRGAAYREEGWTGFDDTANPYGTDEILAERERWRERRSFATVADDTDLIVDDGMADEGAPTGSNPLGSSPRI